MSAAAPAPVTKKQLKRQLFNGIKNNDAVIVRDLIPRLRAAGLDLDTNLEEYHESTMSSVNPIYPLSIAVFYNALDVLRVLIDNGARKNIVEQFYIMRGEDNNNEYEQLDKEKVFTPLRYAIYYKKDDAALMLLEAGAKYPDEDDFVNNNNGIYNNENNDEETYPAGYTGMIDELLTNSSNSPLFVRIIKYILTHSENIGMTRDEIVDELLVRLKNISNYMPLFKIIYETSNDKIHTYVSMFPYIKDIKNPRPFFTYVFENGIDPNTTNEDGETVLFMYTDPLRETVDKRVAIIKGLIELGVNAYLRNNMGETAAARAIKMGLPKPIIEALNQRSLDKIYEMRQANPYIVNRLANTFTKRHLRNTPKSYRALLTKALSNNTVRNNARIAFRPANFPNLYGRTAKNYERLKANQRRRHAETQRSTSGGRRQRQQRRLVNLKRIRRRTLKATKPQ
jgi:hypothetical protein